MNRPAEPADHQVRIATLRKEHRTQLETDTLFDPVKTVAEIVAEIGHQRPQSGFADSPRAEFDILGKDVDAPIIRQIDSPAIEWPSITRKGAASKLASQAM